MATGCGTARRMKAADMRTGSRAPFAVAVAMGMLVLTLAVPVSARLGRWVNVGCETPQTFYSSGHLPGGRPMCCANADRLVRACVENEELKKGWSLITAGTGVLKFSKGARRVVASIASADPQVCM